MPHNLLSETRHLHDSPVLSVYPVADFVFSTTMSGHLLVHATESNVRDGAVPNQSIAFYCADHSKYAIQVTGIFGSHHWITATAGWDKKIHLYASPVSLTLRPQELRHTLTKPDKRSRYSQTQNASYLYGIRIQIISTSCYQSETRLTSTTTELRKRQRVLQTISKFTRQEDKIWLPIPTPGSHSRPLASRFARWTLPYSQLQHLTFHT